MAAETYPDGIPLQEILDGAPGVAHKFALSNAIRAAGEADATATAFEGIHDEHPRFEAFVSYYRQRAVMYAELAQAWASIAIASAAARGWQP